MPGIAAPRWSELLDHGPRLSRRSALMLSADVRRVADEAAAKLRDLEVQYSLTASKGGHGLVLGEGLRQLLQPFVQDSAVEANLLTGSAGRAGGADAEAMIVHEARTWRGSAPAHCALREGKASRASSKEPAGSRTTSKATSTYAGDSLSELSEVEGEDQGSAEGHGLPAARTFRIVPRWPGTQQDADEDAPILQHDLGATVKELRSSIKAVLKQPLTAQLIAELPCGGGVILGDDAPAHLAAGAMMGLSHIDVGHVLSREQMFTFADDLLHFAKAYGGVRPLPRNVGESARDAVLPKYGLPVGLEGAYAASKVEDDHFDGRGGSGVHRPRPCGIRLAGPHVQIRPGSGGLGLTWPSSQA